MNPVRDSERSDEELLAAARREGGGEAARAAAGELLGRYQDRAYLWCWRMVRDHEQALDLAQDALLSAYRSLAGFDGRSRFSSWLFAIVRNRCLSALRPRGLKRDEAVEPESLCEDGMDPLEKLALVEEESVVLAAIRDGLEPVEQEALWLRAVERVPVEQITRLLGIRAASGARGVLQSARRKLRTRLAAWEGGTR